jgi:isochorismate synthase
VNAANSFTWRRPDGSGFTTNGIADLIDADDVAKLTPRFGDRAIAVAALPFRGTNPLVVPARVTHFDAAGAGASFELGDPDRWLEPPSSPPSLVRVPRRFVIEAIQDLSMWDAAVAAALAAIDDGVIEKVVLAREVVVEADAPFDVRSALDRLTRTQPGCYIYAQSGFANSGFIGASPELLVKRDDTRITSRPMAGTAARHEDPAADDRAVAMLQASTKDDLEHRLVIDWMRSVLGPCTKDLSVGPPQPERFTTVTHLTTAIHAELIDLDLTALDLARALHPTPAVGGAPQRAALEAIERLEPFSRGNYAGAVGYVDAAGDGEFAVALRCADIDGRRARLLAGAGIVAGSDPDLEWVETQAKLEPMLRCLVRP